MSKVAAVAVGAKSRRLRGGWWIWSGCARAHRRTMCPSRWSGAEFAIHVSWMAGPGHQGVEHWCRDSWSDREPRATVPIALDVGVEPGSPVLVC